MVLFFKMGGGALLGIDSEYVGEEYQEEYQEPQTA